VYGQWSDAAWRRFLDMRRPRLLPMPQVLARLSPAVRAAIATAGPQPSPLAPSAL